MNQENRLKLMLSNAKANLEAQRRREAEESADSAEKEPATVG